MNKRKFGRKLSRGQGARKALFRSLTKALVEYGSITTTKAKVKAYQSEIDKLIKFAKKGNLDARRRVYAKLGNDRKTTDKIFQVIAKAFSDRNGGYTRTINLPRRKGDNAEMVRLEWTEEVGDSKRKSKSKEKRAESSKKPTSRVKKIAGGIRRKNKNKSNPRKSLRVGDPSGLETAKKSEKK